MTKLTPLQSRYLAKAYVQPVGFPSHRITFSAADSRLHAVFVKNSNVSYKVHNPLFSEYPPLPQILQQSDNWELSNAIRSDIYILTFEKH